MTGNSTPSICRERCEFLLSLTDVEKVRILYGRPVPRADPVSSIERQFLRAHLSEAEKALLWSCI